MWKVKVKLIEKGSVSETQLARGSVSQNSFVSGRLDNDHSEGM